MPGVVRANGAASQRIIIAVVQSRVNTSPSAAFACYTDRPNSAIAAQLQRVETSILAFNEPPDEAKKDCDEDPLSPPVITTPHFPAGYGFCDGRPKNNNVWIP